MARIARLYRFTASAPAKCWAGRPSCFFPSFAGAFLSRDSKTALWDRFFAAEAPLSLNDLGRDLVGRRRQVRVFERVILKPKDVEVEGLDSSNATRFSFSFNRPLRNSLAIFANF
jgi:hypothetical protein